MEKENIKIVFMDCDGVINSTSFYVSDRCPGNLHGQEGDIDPECVERILRVVNETGAKIVLSSDWRISWPGSLIRLEKAGFPEGLIIDKTPELIWTMISRSDYMNSDEEDTRYEYSRGREIDMWLEAHPECTNYCIIDDRTDFTEEQQPHFVHVDPYIGITDDNADIAVMILNHH